MDWNQFHIQQFTLKKKLGGGEGGWINEKEDLSSNSPHKFEKNMNINYTCTMVRSNRII